MSTEFLDPPQQIVLPTLTFRYYKKAAGLVSTRTVLSPSLFWGSNEWHKKPQWLLHGIDTSRNDWRTFPVTDIEFLGIKQINGNISGD